MSTLPLPNVSVEGTTVPPPPDRKTIPLRQFHADAELRAADVEEPGEVLEPDSRRHVRGDLLEEHLPTVGVAREDQRRVPLAEVICVGGIVSQHDRGGAVRDPREGALGIRVSGHRVVHSDEEQWLPVHVQHPVFVGEDLHAGLRQRRADLVGEDQRLVVQSLDDAGIYGRRLGHAQAPIVPRIAPRQPGRRIVHSSIWDCANVAQRPAPRQPPLRR